MTNLSLRLFSLLLLSLGFVLAGCPSATGGGDDDDSATSDDDDAANDDDSGGEVSFANDVAPIVFGNCSCHGSGAGGWAHNNSEADLYAAWVGIDRTDGGMARVEAGSADDSYVWHKISGTQDTVGGGGQQMPLGGSPDYLDPADRDVIEAWIDGGAADN